MKPIIRNEHPADFSAVEHIAFWNQYIPGCSEHFLVHTIATPIICPS